jgi:hypothetical protein
VNLGAGFGAASAPANTTVCPTVSISIAQFNTTGTQFASNRQNTADNKYETVTVKGFTIYGYVESN